MLQIMELVANLGCITDLLDWRAIKDQGPRYREWLDDAVTVAQRVVLRTTGT
jgi:hypothetical protein